MTSMDANPSAECSIGIHQFTDKFLDTTVHFQVLKMSDSFHVWCGSSPLLSNMAVAIQTKYVSRNGTSHKKLTNIKKKSYLIISSTYSFLSE